MKLYESITRAENQIDIFSSLISSKKEYLGKQALNLLLLTVILIVTGCMDFMHPALHLERVFNISFWSAIISKLIAGICAYNIGINLLWDITIKRDTILASAIETYNRLITYIQIDFEFFITKVFNPELKRKAYISSINRKIYLLNKFSRPKDRLLYTSDLPERQEEKKTNKYCILRKQLEELKSEEYIKKNFDALNVRYMEVDPAIFELEINGSQKTTGIKTRGSVTEGKAKASVNVALTMLLISAFTTALAFELSGSELVEEVGTFMGYLIKCVIDVATIIWQFLRGMFSVRTLVSKEVTEPYNGRNKVLQCYIDWRINEKLPDTSVYKELHKEEFVEMTEEEYAKLHENEENKDDNN